MTLTRQQLPSVDHNPHVTDVHVMLKRIECEKSFKNKT